MHRKMHAEKKTKKKENRRNEQSSGDNGRRKCGKRWYRGRSGAESPGCSLTFCRDSCRKEYRLSGGFRQFLSFRRRDSGFGGRVRKREVRNDESHHGTSSGRHEGGSGTDCLSGEKFKESDREGVLQSAGERDLYDFSGSDDRTESASSHWRADYGSFTTEQ